MSFHSEEICDGLGVASLVCPNCGGKSEGVSWGETSVFCEQCGDHAAIKCPLCKDVFDCVWGFSEVEEATKEALKFT